MGNCYWLKVPSWKVLIFLGKGNFDEGERENFQERMDKIVSAVKEFDFEITEQKVSEFSARDMSKVIGLVDRMWIIDEFGFKELMLMYLLAHHKIKFEVVGEWDVDEHKMKDARWIIERGAYG